MTPEGKVKAKVKKLLAEYVPLVKGYWPVQNGMGTPMLDYLGSCCGMHFEIETKATMQDELTPRQSITRNEVIASAAPVFVIRDVNDPELAELKKWIEMHIRAYLKRQLKGK